MAERLLVACLCAEWCGSCRDYRATFAALAERFSADADFDDSVLGACRAASPVSGEGAVTRLPELLVARYRGDSAPAARTYFATLWRLLRPALAGRESVPPRIWNT